jgi:hypothetical protein
MTQALLIQASEERSGQFPDALTRLLKDFNMFPSNWEEEELSAAWSRFNRMVPKYELEEEAESIAVAGDFPL